MENVWEAPDLGQVPEEVAGEGPYDKSAHIQSDKKDFRYYRETLLLVQLHSLENGWKCEFEVAARPDRYLQHVTRPLLVLVNNQNRGFGH